MTQTNPPGSLGEELALDLRGARTNPTPRRRSERNAPVSKFSANSKQITNSISLKRSCRLDHETTNRDDSLLRTNLPKTGNPRSSQHSVLLLLKLVALVHQFQCSAAATSAARTVAKHHQRQYVATLSSTQVVAAADLELDHLLELSPPLPPPLLAREYQDEPELVPVGRIYERNAAATENVATAQVGGANHLIEFLETLPVSSVGHKRTAQFECDLRNEKNDATHGQLSESSSMKLVWLKLVRPATLNTPDSTRVGVSLPANDITPLSLDKRIITPDKRFKVRHQPPSRWTLSIENVSLADDKAYFVCQVSGGGGGGAVNNQNFIGGGRLNVLMPPQIVDADTSPNLVLVDEFSSLKLQCKVISEQQSQISWRREDGHSLDGLELRFRHQLERRPHQLLSIDSSELLVGSVRREQAGAYLCIASNGVQPGVSQRISVVVVNCRDIEGPEGKPEPCRDEPTATEVDDEFAQTPTPDETTPPIATSGTTTFGTTTAGSTTIKGPTQTGTPQPQNRSTKRTWTTTSVRANANGTLATRRQQTGDKSGRTMRYNNGNRQEPASKRIATPPVRRGEGDNEPGNGSGGSSLPIGMGGTQISAIWPVLVCALICISRSLIAPTHFH